MTKLTGFARYDPVFDKDGNVVLYDIYLENNEFKYEWWGSRRTLEQCREVRRNARKQDTGRRPQ